MSVENSDTGSGSIIDPRVLTAFYEADKARIQPRETLAKVLKILRKGNNSPQSTAAKQLEQVAESGTECDVEMLYEGPSKCSCCINWVDEFPDDLKSSIEEEPETKKKALVVRMGKNHAEGRPLALHSIVVRNQQIKDLLNKALDGCKDITPNLEKLVLRSPFREFFYRWDLFQKLVDQQKANGEDAAPFSQLLHTILDLELRGTREEKQDLCKNGVITYDLLWTLFEPGLRVFSSADGHDRLYIVKEVEYTKYEFGLTAKYIDSNGEVFGFATEDLSVMQFSGTRRITRLPVYPITYHKSGPVVENALRLRGRTFQTLKGIHYKEYASGKSRGGVSDTRQNTAFRIVIDASAAPWSPRRFVPLEEPPASPAIDDVDDSKPPGDSSQAKDTTDHSLSDEKLMLCSPYTHGFSLRDKSWGTFCVDNVKDVVWNDDAFPSLLLSEGHKDLILAFVEGQLTHGKDFDDVVKGKGQGLTILLRGSPGTGKTLTAEAVADKVRQPLYILSAGELGQTASGVEYELKEVLKLTERWGAVLLLDECDVFLGKRSRGKLEHNEVVAVFLRLLEYYPGMLFLTTNRSKKIDSAFRSRIHLTIEYPELDVETRKHIWTQFASRSPVGSSLSDGDLTKLSRHPMNGRQIKNIIKTSCLLARRKGTALQLDNINTVLKVTGEIE